MLSVFMTHVINFKWNHLSTYSLENYRRKWILRKRKGNDNVNKWIKRMRKRMNTRVVGHNVDRQNVDKKTKNKLNLEKKYPPPGLDRRTPQCFGLRTLASLVCVNGIFRKNLFQIFHKSPSSLLNIKSTISQKLRIAQKKLNTLIWFRTLRTF